MKSSRQLLLALVIILTMVTTANSQGRRGFGNVPLQSKQQDDYDYWLRRKERDYEDALASQRANQPVKKSAKELGIESAKRGDGKDTNPYAKDYFDWIKGWREGQNEQK